MKKVASKADAPNGGLHRLAEALVCGEPDILGGVLSTMAESIAAEPKKPDNILELPINSLIKDKNGEVVFSETAGFGGIRLVGSEVVVSEGRSPSHITASGFDVRGFSYKRLGSGMIVYYPDFVRLDVVPARAMQHSA